MFKNDPKNFVNCKYSQTLNKKDVKLQIHTNQLSKIFKKTLRGRPYNT